jgi:hypothetical protein
MLYCRYLYLLFGVCPEPLRLLTHHLQGLPTCHTQGHPSIHTINREHDTLPYTYVLQHAFSPNHRTYRDDLAMDVQAYLCHDAIAESHPRGMAPAQTLPPLGTHRQDSTDTQGSAHRLIHSMIVYSSHCACMCLCRLL